MLTPYIPVWCSEGPVMLVKCSACVNAWLSNMYMYAYDGRWKLVVRRVRVPLKLVLKRVDGASRIETVDQQSSSKAVSSKASYYWLLADDEATARFCPSAYMYMCMY